MVEEEEEEDKEVEDARLVTVSTPFLPPSHPAAHRYDLTSSNPPFLFSFDRQLPHQERNPFYYSSTLAALTLTFPLRPLTFPP